MTLENQFVALDPISRVSGSGDEGTLFPRGKGEDSGLFFAPSSLVGVSDSKPPVSFVEAELKGLPSDEGRDVRVAEALGRRSRSAHKLRNFSMAARLSENLFKVLMKATTSDRWRFSFAG